MTGAAGASPPAMPHCNMLRRWLAGECSAALCSAALCSATNSLHVNCLHVNHCDGQTAVAFVTRALLFTLTTYLPASQAISSVVALRGIRCCIVNNAGVNCSACDLSAINWRGVSAKGDSISTTCVGVSQNAVATVWSIGILGIPLLRGPNDQSVWAFLASPITSQL